jgi:hypothetical protein
MANFNISDPQGDRVDPWNWPNQADSISAPDQARINALLAEWNAEKRDVASQKVADTLAGVNDKAANALADVNRKSADRLAQAQNVSSIVAAYIQVAQASLDRAISRGQYITTAAGAIVTAYTTLIGATYSSSSKLSVVNPTALIPPAFLGIAIVFAVAYIAFLKQSPSPKNLLLHGDHLYTEDDEIAAKDLDYRLRIFCYWTYGGVRDRSGYLHMSVYALAIGVALLPISFLKLSGSDGWKILGAGLVALLAAAVALHLNHKFKVSPSLASELQE